MTNYLLIRKNVSAHKINTSVNNVLVMLFFVAQLLILNMSGCAVITGETTSAPVNKNEDRITELVIIDQESGNAERADVGRQVHVHYTGWLYDKLAKDNKGTKFDSSHDRGQPFVFTLGKRQVIDGWDKGVVGMQVGGKRRLIIPSDLAYGRRGSGRSIPPNSVLVFDVELVEVR